MANLRDGAADELVGLIPRLRRFALALTGHRADADDLVQDALERAWTRIEQWKPGTRLDSWVFKIAQNAWIDQSRTRAVRARVVTIDPDADAPGIDGREAMNARISLSKALETLNQLSPDQRAAVALVQIEGFTYPEAAAILGVPEGTLTSRLGRARAALEKAVFGEDVET